VRKTLNPRYDWDFFVSYDAVDDALAETMTVIAWDMDNSGKIARAKTAKADDKLGSGFLMLGHHRRALLAGERVDVSVPLEYKTRLGKVQDAGEVHFALTWEDFNADAANMAKLRYEREMAEKALKEGAARRRMSMEAVIAERDAQLEAANAEAAQEAAVSEFLLAQRDNKIEVLEDAVAKDTVTIATLREVGRMHVSISHAAKLRACDSNGLSDPYVEVSVGGRSEKTQTIKKTLAPKYDWSTLFDFDSIDVPLKQPISVIAWDYDMLNFDDKIGNCLLNLEEHRAALIAGTKIELVAHLKYTPGGRTLAVDAGEVHVAVWWEFKSPGAASEHANAPSTEPR